ncbi:hypothetical protein MesoLjLc_60840 [Mesorhizobium sp. L-8-10]|uniref:darcynin family protein n=1 Tax=Mesorhizobium sp. L-8-10 TaxID=2744523 RepID=UPI001928095D|nr:darcynin family protein [Mesorhizobium sp. L-8-10]BCH34154.1 hypothetical protein MesoLjLc_60840 [Mesorhizobium sp. L-8-10]
MTTPKPRFTIFVLLRTLPSWLSLPRSRRNEIANSAFADTLKDESVTIRHFDAEAFTAFCTDIAMFEADDLISFHFVMERLRDSAFFAEPYFELVQIIPAVEDGFRYFENTAA